MHYILCTCENETIRRKYSRCQSDNVALKKKLVTVYHIFVIKFISRIHSVFENRMKMLVMYWWEKCTMTLTLWLFSLSKIIIFPLYLHHFSAPSLCHFHSIHSHSTFHFYWIFFAMFIFLLLCFNSTSTIFNEREKNCIKIFVKGSCTTE